MVKIPKPYEYLRGILGTRTMDYNSWHTFNCPLCNENKQRCGVKVATNIVHCFNCGRKMTINKFLEQITYLSKIDIDVLVTRLFLLRDEVTNISSTIVGTDFLEAANAAQISIDLDIPLTADLSDLSHKKVIRAREYLQSRDISLTKAENFGFAVVLNGKNSGRLFIPIYKKGKLVNYILRGINNEPIRYIAAKRGDSEVFFNEDAMFTSDEIVITEGFACAMLFKNGVANCGCTINKKKIETLQNCKATKIHIIPDSGYYLNTDMTNLENWCNIFSKLKDKVITVHDITHTNCDVSKLGKELYKKEVKKFIL